MTLRPSESLSTRYRLRTAALLVLAVGTTVLFTADAHAQTANSGTTSQGADITAGEAGSTLTSQNVFSSTADGASAIGENDGRFSTSRLATQPNAAGSTSDAQQNALNQARNLQRLNQSFGRSNQTQNRNRGNTQGTRTIRPSLRLGFVPTPRPTEELRTALGKQVQALAIKLPQLADGRSEFASVKFDFGNRGEVILSGEVPNDDSARLLANILRMEPGVASVQNDLKIAQPAATEPAAE